MPDCGIGEAFAAIADAIGSSVAGDAAASTIAAAGTDAAAAAGTVAGTTAATDAIAASTLDAGISAGTDAISSAALDTANSLTLNAADSAAINSAVTSGDLIGSSTLPDLTAGTSSQAALDGATGLQAQDAAQGITATANGVPSATYAGAATAANAGFSSGALANLVGDIAGPDAGAAVDALAQPVVDAYKYVSAIPSDISSSIEQSLGLPTGTLSGVTSGVKTAMSVASLLGLGGTTSGKATTYQVNMGGPPAIDTSITTAANMSGLFNSSPTGSALAANGIAMSPSYDPTTGLTGTQLIPTNISSGSSQNNPVSSAADNINQQTTQTNSPSSPTGITSPNVSFVNSNPANTNGNENNGGTLGLSPEILASAINSKPVDFSQFAHLSFAGDNNSSDIAKMGNANSAETPNPVLAMATKF